MKQRAGTPALRRLKGGISLMPMNTQRKDAKKTESSSF